MAIFDLGFNDAANAAQDFAGAAGDLLTAGGLRKERDAYVQAAGFAGQNADIEKESLAEQAKQRRIQQGQLAIQASQENRQFYLASGTQRAEIAGSGLSESGSAMDIIRDTQGQGEMQVQLQKSQSSVIDIQGAVAEKQGQININSYLAQQGSYTGQAHAADAAASTADASAAGKIAAGAIHTGSALVHLLTLGLF